MKVVFVIRPVWRRSNVLEHTLILPLNTRGITAELIDNPVEMFLAARNFHIAHFIGYVTPIRWLILILLLKLMRKRIIVHWVGSDVLKIMKEKRARMRAKLTNKMIDKHLTVAPWLSEELKSVGIFADVVPRPCNIKSEVIPLPKKFTVLAHLPETRYKFYGGDIIEKLADEFPFVRFLIVANDGKKRGKWSNLKYLGFVSYDSMPAIYKNSSVLIRITYHDGLPRMILEALALGRYVIFSKSFPYCYHARNYNEVKNYVLRLLTTKKPNYEGAEFVRSNFNENDLINKILKIYSELFKTRSLETSPSASLYHFLYRALTTK